MKAQAIGMGGCSGCMVPKPGRSTPGEGPPSRVTAPESSATIDLYHSGPPQDPLLIWAHKTQFLSVVWGNFYFLTGMGTKLCQLWIMVSPGPRAHRYNLRKSEKHWWETVETNPSFVAAEFELDPFAAASHLQKGDACLQEMMKEIREMTYALRVSAEDVTVVKFGRKKKGISFKKNALNSVILVSLSFFF